MRFHHDMPAARTISVAYLAIPFLVLAGMVWLWGAGDGMPQDGAQGRWVFLGAALALMVYGLGAVLAGGRADGRLATWRALRRLRPGLEDESGGADGRVIWASDPQGRVVWQSAAAQRLHGDRIGGMIGPALARLIADPDGAIGRLINRAGLSGEAGLAVADGRLSLRASGNEALLIWSLLSDTDTASAPSAPVSPPAIEGFDALPVALIRLDRDGRVVRANAAARILLPGVAKGASLQMMLDGLGRSVSDWLDDVLHGRIAPRPEMLRSRHDGDEHFLQVTLARDGADGLIAVLSDANALKTLEAQFVQSQKMQAIGQLAGGIAHDFNNVLTAISGHCDLLMLRRDATDPDYADLQQISQNANRAASLVGQLLAFSRKQTLKPEVFDLRDTLSDLTHLLRRLVSEKVSLSFDHDPELRLIRTDPRQFDQVLMNLVVNARDAMPDGGRIAIRTENVRLGAPMIRARATIPPGDYVLISVRDEGCGIAPEKIDKLFEPFFTTKRVGEGTGLGLATVYGIVKQSGGYVFCDSQPGSGATFSLYFPAHDRQELPAPRPEAPTPPAMEESVAQPASILLVEDEAAVRAFAARALQLSDFEVSEAESGEAALDLLADPDRRFDVFVTDVVMPGMDGPAWVRTALRDRPDTRVIFMSGYSEDIFVDGTPAIEDAQFLQKPFTLTQLTNLVRAEVAARRGAGSADMPAGSRLASPAVNNSLTVGH